MQTNSGIAFIVGHTTMTKTGERSFSCTSNKVWNGLPSALRTGGCTHTFKSKLKTHLFKSAYLYVAVAPFPYLWFVFFDYDTWCVIHATYNTIQYQPTRQLRSSSKNQVTRQTTITSKHRQRSFSCSAAEIWNDLPENLRAISEEKHFKAKLKTHFFSKISGVVCMYVSSSPLPPLRLPGDPAYMAR